MKRLFTLFAIAFLSCTLIACGGKPTPPDPRTQVTANLLDANMEAAKSNTRSNAAEFRGQSSDLGEKYDIFVNIDSSMTIQCPSGDGWATVEFRKKSEFINEPGARSVEAKCSTWSRAKGCMLSSHFNQSAVAKEDKVCQKDVPYPISKIGS